MQNALTVFVTLMLHFYQPSAFKLVLCLPIFFHIQKQQLSVPDLHLSLPSVSDPRPSTDCLSPPETSSQTPPDKSINTEHFWVKLSQRKLVEMFVYIKLVLIRQK